MTISTTTDINLAIVALDLHNNEYLLSDNLPPHTIIEWYGPDPQPSDDDLNNAFDALPDTRYQQQRRREYPHITDQLDQLYHDIRQGRFGTDAANGDWYVGITSVKNKYPNPN